MPPFPQYIFMACCLIKKRMRLPLTSAAGNRTSVVQQRSHYGV